MTPEEKKESNRDAQKRYREKNREKVRKASLDNYYKNKERRQAKNKEWREKNKEHLREYNQKWFAEHADYRAKYYQDNKEHHDAVVQQWRVNNIDRAREIDRDEKRRKKKNGICASCSKPVISVSRIYCEDHWFKHKAKEHLGDWFRGYELKQKLVDQNYTCPYTGEKLVIGVNANLDHIMPSSRYPELEHDIDNLQWVSKKANDAKDAMTPDEFIAFCQLVIEYRKTNS